MSFSRVFFWLVIFALLTIDYTDEMTKAKVYYWSSRYWYGLASFVGNLGLKSEQKYHTEMETARG